METDPSEDEYSKEATFLSQITTNSPLPSSVAKLSGSSRGIPYEKDFHFYKNFEDFKNPVKEIDEKSKTLLERIGVSSQLWGKSQEYPGGLVIDDFDGYDWLVNINDDVLEKLDASLDEFRALREEESGFQVVKGRKNRRGVSSSEDCVVKGKDGLVQVAMKPKPKIPFHIPTIRRPQDEYKIVVNNVNQPFEHVWMDRSEDGTRCVHPLEKFSVLDFVDASISNITPQKPQPLESTPFKLVEEVKELKHLAAKLKNVDEFAVDLEHNQYRSFQGLTCLMQISTRTEDFVIDTLKLRIHVGPYLREAFKDPSKKKVLHGADRDILWLQRDFGIYVCNLFDTGQASRVLQLERYSLEYLLHHFCGVTANKEYQNADWRLRPLPPEMVRYAREDTHYLLYIYDLMRMRLLTASTDSESADPPLVEVYKRSYDICLQRYEKELLTDGSYLHIYGLQGAGFNSQQLAVVAGLCEWRDVVARAEDESTGYVLPNKTLLEIAKHMPLTVSSLRRSLKSKHPYIERNLGSILSIIRHSMQNAVAFEEVAEQLKEWQTERASENSLATEVSEICPPEASDISGTVVEAENVAVSTVSNNSMSRRSLASVEKQKLKSETLVATGVTANQQASPEHPHECRSLNNEMESDNITIPRVVCGVSERLGEAGAIVLVQKKPNRAFGSMLGGSGKRKLQSDKKDQEDSKLEQIKSLVNLPFHSFHSTEDRLQPVEQHSIPLNSLQNGEPVANGSDVEDFILLGASSDVEDSVNEGTEGAKQAVENREDKAVGSSLEMEEGDETMTLSDLSSSFEKCFPSLSGIKDSKLVEKSQESTGFLQLKPFDYETAMQQVIYGEDPGRKLGHGADEDNRNRLDKGKKKISSVTGRSQKEGTGDLPQGRRRQAFPASGNRSATFR